MEKEFRFDLELAKKHLESIFPDEMVRNSYLKAITECAKIATKENNANWNVNLSNHLIRVNCGARYIFDMRNERLRVMCWRETFLKLDKDFIDEFLKEVFFYKEDTKELMASDFNPQTYEELEKVPTNILWHNSLQFNINPKLWAEKYAEKLMPSVLDFCKDCIKHSSIMPQMRKAHSASLIELINKEMNENLIQPEYIKEQLNYENDDLERFKSLLEYFVTHMEYVVNENKDFVGYSKYIFPIQDSFKKTGIGYKGQKIQTQIANWSKYKEKEICINVHASHGSFQKRNCYLNWKGSWNNVHVEWKENNITSLYLSKEPKVDAKKELEKTIEQLGLFSENITDDLKAFFDEYMKWGIGDSQMTDYEKKLDEIKENLEANKNVILTGAPGTGKTFMAKQIAKELGCEDDNIDFVQFHPSYDYTNFVEGLRPKQVDGSDQIGFERKDGVFKKFCEKALKNLVDSRKSAEEITKENDVKNLVNSFLNEIYENETKFKTSSTENEFQIKSIDENFITISIPSNEKTSELKLSISDIHQILLSDAKLEKVKDLISIFNRKNHRQEDSYLFVLCKEIRQKQKLKSEITEKIPLKNFVFIIDEINRGEVAKIFGELFYSVDPGYRVTSDDLDAIKNGNKTVTTIKTQYANLETKGNEFDKALKSTDYGHFFIPENVYIIGTMNDIDRSVESMDFAFRRRFSWIEVKASDTVDMLDPKYDDNGKLIAGLEKNLAEEAKRRMKNLNAAISKIEDLNDAYHIGASYFLKLKNYAGDFESLWNYHIKGILQEYLRGNPNGKLEDLKAAYDKAEDLKAGE
jgi:DNA polymerase III delta prime subunit